MLAAHFTASQCTVPRAPAFYPPPMSRDFGGNQRGHIIQLVALQCDDTHAMRALSNILPSADLETVRASVSTACLSVAQQARTCYDVVAGCGWQRLRSVLRCWSSVCAVSQRWLPCFNSLAVKRCSAKAQIDWLSLRTAFDNTNTSRRQQPQQRCSHQRLQLPKTSRRPRHQRQICTDIRMFGSYSLLFHRKTRGNNQRRWLLCMCGRRILDPSSFVRVDTRNRWTKRLDAMSFRW